MKFYAVCPQDRQILRPADHNNHGWTYSLLLWLRGSDAPARLIRYATRRWKNLLPNTAATEEPLFHFDPIPRPERMDFSGAPRTPVA